MKKFAIYGGVFFTVLFLWLALRNTNYQNIQQAFITAKLWPMAPMFFCLFVFYCLKAIRWKTILSTSYELKASQLAPAMMAGAAGNNLLPAHMGELIRVYFVGTQFGIPKSRVLATLIVERLFDVISVLTLLSIAFLFGNFNGQVYLAGGFLLFVAIATIITSIMLITQHTRWVAFVHDNVTFLSPMTRYKIGSQITHLTTGLQSMLAQHLFFPVLLSSIVQWLLMALCIYFSLVAFDINISPFHSIIILGLTVAGLVLPTSPGFFGTIEYCFVLGLSAVNVDPSIALSAAIYYHVPIWVVVTLIGLRSIRRQGYSLKQLNSEKTVTDHTN